MPHRQRNAFLAHKSFAPSSSQPRSQFKTKIAMYIVRNTILLPHVHRRASLEILIVPAYCRGGYIHQSSIRVLQRHESFCVRHPWRPRHRIGLRLSGPQSFKHRPTPQFPFSVAPRDTTEIGNKKREDSYKDLGMLDLCSKNALRRKGYTSTSGESLVTLPPNTDSRPSFRMRFSFSLSLLPLTMALQTIYLGVDTSSGQT